jgi:chaperone modulatory protein CbpM
MATKKLTNALTAVMLDEQTLDLLDICRAVGAPAETVVEMIEYGVIEPSKGNKPATWQFSAYALKRTRVATRLQRDLRINLEGLGLALDLLEEVQELRRRVHFYEQHHFTRD